MGNLLSKKNAEDIFFLFTLTVVIVLLFYKSLNIFFIADDTDWIIIARQPLDSSFLLRRTGLAVFRPVINALFFLQHKAFGLDFRLYHLTNIVFHCLNTFLVYFLLLHFLKEKKCVFLGALFFAVTYSHHQAVIWIGAIVDEVCAFFYLLSVLLFLRFHRTKGAGYFAASLLMYVFALGAKEVVLTLPLALLLLEYFLLKARAQECLKHVSAYLVLTVLYLSAMKILFSDFSSRVFSGTSDYALGLHFLPNTLSCLVQLLYPLLGTGAAPAQAVFPGVLTVPGALLLLLSVFLLVLARFSATGDREAGKLFITGVALTAVTIVPASFFHSMMRFGSFTRFRYLYLPSAVFSIALASLFVIVFKKKNQMFFIEKVFVSFFMGYVFIVNVPAHEKIIKEYTIVGDEQKRIIETALQYSSGQGQRENNLFLVGYPFSFKYIYEPHMRNALDLYTKKSWKVLWLRKEEFPSFANQKGLFLSPESMR